jgi:hypothetical protein
VRLPDDIQAWPGVGPVSAGKLRADGVPDFIHLLAKYVTTYRRDDQRMYDYLKSKGIDGQHRNTIVSALKARVAETERRDNLPRDRDPRISQSMWDNAVRNGYVQNGVPSLLSQYNDHKPVEPMITHRHARNDHVDATPSSPSYHTDEGRYGSSGSSSTAQTSAGGAGSLSNYLLLALAIMFAWYLMIYTK